MNSLLKLAQHGQSYWLDNLTSTMIETGKLRRRVEQQGLRGVTSNPAIFKHAIAESRDYDDAIDHLIADGCEASALYEALVTEDVRGACDVLLPVFRRTAARDGYVSLEVSPHLAHDAKASTKEARRLYAEVARPNLMIKIPATTEGLEAIETLLFDGISVNVTLLFAIERYADVAEAHMRALERRVEAGLSLDDVASVASFFLSRIDVLVDRLLEQRIGAGLAEAEAARKLLGKVAVANAKIAYRQFESLVGGSRWRALADRGARPQRLLWASTSQKNPGYRDVAYVEPLIGPQTVTTLPESTIAAFEDHGRVRETLREGFDEARGVLNGLDALGIDLAAATEQLLNEGVQKFIDAYDALLDEIESRRRQHESRAIGP